MKINALLLSFLFCFFFQPGEVQSKNKQGTHTFKIVGSKKFFDGTYKKVVEYDPESKNHLYITSYGENGKIVRRSQMLFTGKKFSLGVSYLNYKSKEEIFIDGSETLYRKDGTIDRAFVYEKDQINFCAQALPGWTETIIDSRG